MGIQKRIILAISIIAIAFIYSHKISYADQLPANALTIGEYISDAKKDPKLKEIIFRAGNSYSWVNGVLSERNQPKLYCQPDIALNADNYFNILENYTKRNNWVLNMNFRYLDGVLIEVLTDAFPCK